MTAACPVRAKSCFLFDLDGTLVDSTALHERAFRATLAAHAPHLLEGFRYREWMGRTTTDTFRGAGVGEAVLASLIVEKQRRYRDFVRAGALELQPGARELLERLGRKGKRQWLVTSASARAVEEVLARTGIGGYFEGVVTAADAARGKPDPEPYRLCLERFGLEAEASVAIEDAADGVESARRAGLDVVCVGDAAADGAGWWFRDLASFGRWLEKEAE
jgi:HAD superfamily hydrolase (TIGR01509 family)